MYRELRERVDRNPAPTEEELSLGSYLEALEPQVRDAVREMRRRGYVTNSSGFYGYDHAAQVVEGDFELPAAVAADLGRIDVEVERQRRITLVRFYPDDADLEEIRERWDRVAALFPDLGRAAPPTRDFDSGEFRRLHREGRLRAGFIRHWLDAMGTYAGMSEPSRG